MIVLERFMDHSRDPAMGCLSELSIDGEFVCYMIGQPWRDNKPEVSCVPVGEYDLKQHDSPTYGRVVVMVNHDLGVYRHKSEAGPGDRWGCLWHPANWAHQLKGCEAPGREITWGLDRKNPSAAGNLMVTDSAKTLKWLLPRVTGKKLLIRWRHER